MFNFSEKFVEECVADVPNAFLPFRSTVKARQARLGGFKPDLILVAEDGQHIILEIQLNALDRSHLYKVLEYRDLYAECDGVVFPKLILMAENVPERYLSILKTHCIDIITFNRFDFTKAAIISCPHIAAKYIENFIEPDDSVVEKVNPKNAEDFEPYRWSDYRTPTEIEAYFNRECRRIGIDRYNLPREYQRSVVSDLSQYLNDPFVHVIDAIYRPDHWNWDNLRLNYTDGYGLRFRKPKISLGCHITIKRNFTAYFWGDDDVRRQSESDWIRPPHEGTYGWGRPNNELLFIRGAGDLDPRPKLQKSGWSDYSGLDSILVAWISAAYLQAIRIAKCFYDVEVFRQISVELSDDRRRSIMEKPAYLVGWDIISASEKTKSEAESWLREFKKEYGIEVQEFVDAYNIGRGRNPENTAIAPASIVAAISECGGRMLAWQVRDAVDRLKVADKLSFEKLRLPIKD